MNTSSDIWFAFARTFSVLFLVLELFILAFYLIKKFSMGKGIKGGKNYIKVVSVHHLSPKEKLVLLNVLGDTILIGVTPANISKLSSFESEFDFSDDETEAGFNFSDFLAQKLGKSFKNKQSGLLDKGEK